MDLSGGNGSDSMDEHAELKNSLRIMSCTVYSLVFVLGVLGNGFVIWMTGFKMQKTVNTVWYLNLAVADLLFTAFLPLKIRETALDDQLPFGRFMCKLNFTFLSLNMYASVYILMVISVDRCVRVVWPVWAQNHCSVRKASYVSLGVWVLALALSSPYVFFMDTVQGEESEDDIKCSPTFALDDRNSTLWTSRLVVMVFTQFFMAFVIPFTVIVSCYSVIIYRLKKDRLQASQPDRSLASQLDRSFKFIAAVITAFFLCWAPFHIMEQIVLWVKFVVAEDSESTEYVINIGVPIATCLAFLNSCLNPLLYVFMVRDFKNVARKSVREVLSLPKPLPAFQMTVMTETQGIVVELIHDTLKALGTDDFKEFKWHLGKRVNLEGLRPITRDRLEDADRMGTADLIVQTYPQKRVLIVKNVLRKINREDLALKFET